MTTTVTVKTHDWPVEVRTFPLANREPVEGADWSEPQRVEPNSSREFVVHDGQDLMVKELAIEAAQSAETAETETA